MANDDKIQDFGEKIGGARKDLASLNRSLTIDDINDWTKIEKQELINKKQVWKIPNYQNMVNEGIPIEVAYFIKKIRDTLPSKPYLDSEKYQNGYIAFVTDIKDKAMALETIQDANNFFDKEINNKYVVKSYGRTYKPTDETYHCMTTKFLRATQMSENAIRKEISEKKFLYSENEKLLAPYLFVTYDGENVKKENDALTVKKGLGKHYFYRNEPELADISNWKPDTIFIIQDGKSIVANNLENEEVAKAFALEHAKEMKKNASEKTSKTRKQKFTPPQLKNICREGGVNYRQDFNVAGEDMLRDFKFKGGEFGNWESQNDRQTNLNMSYDAFRDLAIALNIKVEDVSLGGKLSIAYGSRGHSSALAHFEPARNVINLTKMKGAGSLAHEWGHAFDFYIAHTTEMQNTYATKAVNSILAPTVSLMKFSKDEKGNAQFTEYYKESKKADVKFSKQDKGYWASEVEMFARAFACYVSDKLEEKGIQSDFLCGHSEASVFPKGDERRIINAAIDTVIDKLKEMELLRIPEKEPEKELQNTEAFYRIYQLKDGENYHYARFQSLKQNQAEGFELNKNDYNLVYEGNLNDIKGSSTEQKLENIYDKFNIDRPDDFKGHSLSVSDIVTAGNEKNENAYYVDNFGFKEYADFLKETVEFCLFRLDEAKEAKDFAIENSYHAQLIPKDITNTDHLYLVYKNTDVIPKKLQEYVEQQEGQLNDFVLRQIKSNTETLCAVESTSDYSNSKTPFNNNDNNERYRMVAVNKSMQKLEAINNSIFNDKSKAENALETICKQNPELIVANHYNDIIYEIGKLFVEHVDSPILKEQKVYSKEHKFKKDKGHER